MSAYLGDNMVDLAFYVCPICKSFDDLDQVHIYSYNTELHTLSCAGADNLYSIYEVNPGS